MRKINFFNNNKSGQVFLMSILVLGAVFGLAILLMAAFIKDLRQSVETSESVKALYAADAAMEWQIYNNLNSLSAPAPSMINGTSFEWKSNFNPSTNKGDIKTVGISGAVRRGLEVNF